SYALTLPFLFTRRSSPRPLHSFPTRRSSDLTLLPLTQTDTLDKLPAGMLMAQIPIGASGEFYTVEARREAGYDVGVQGSAVVIRSEEHTSNSSHVSISYAVFCLKKKTKKTKT